jgi:hypothetical protein
MPEMETQKISPTPATPPYGVGGVKHDRNRQGKRSFEEAFGEEAQKQGAGSHPPIVEEDNTPDEHAEKPLTGHLQDGKGIIRKDEEDGQLHVDIVV